MSDTTENYDLPYPEGGAPANVPYDLQLLAEAVDDALLGVTDTSFFTPASGITVDLKFAAKMGPLVIIQLRLLGVTYASGEQNLLLGTFDAGWVPAIHVSSWSGLGGSGAQLSGIITAATGELSLRNSSESGSSQSVAFSAAFPVDLSA